MKKFYYRQFSGVTKFLLTGLSLYILWIIFYESIVKPNHWIDPWLTNWVSVHSVMILKIFGTDVSQKIMASGNTIMNGPHKVLHIAYLCDGLILYVVFLIFILAFPGPIRHKAWFIPAGFVLIYWINLLRVISLVLIKLNAPEYLAFNHKYTFTLLVYGFIFLLWLFWIRLFSVKQHVNH